MASQSSEGETWIEWFCSQRGHEFLCEVDPAFIAFAIADFGGDVWIVAEDAFNLYGLRSVVPRFRDCLEFILDVASGSDREDWRGDLYDHCADLYGLIHARFILTPRGMQLMLQKYEEREFGRCPNVFCDSQPVLPVGLTDELHMHTVKIFCPRCQNVYHCAHESQSLLDGAYFGSSFPHLLLLCKPQLLPSSPPAQYIPHIYGFRVYGRRGSRAAGALTSGRGGGGAAGGGGRGRAEEDGGGRREARQVPMETEGGGGGASPAPKKRRAGE